MRRRLGVASLIAAVAALSGCHSGPLIDIEKLKLNAFTGAGHKSSSLAVLKERRNADARREAIQELNNPVDLSDKQVIGALADVARTDPNPAVRCTAIRALGNSSQPEAAGALAILSTAVTSSRPTTEWADVRADVFGQLVKLAEAGHADDRTLASALDPSVVTVTKDPARDARIAATRLLGFIRDSKAVETLVGILQQRDFGVVYEAERSLQRLTGQSFQHNAEAWKSRLAATPQPLSQPPS
jgi:HEAT repeat protein